MTTARRRQERPTFTADLGNPRMATEGPPPSASITSQALGAVRTWPAVGFEDALSERRITRLGRTSTNGKRHDPGTTNRTIARQQGDVVNDACCSDELIGRGTPEVEASRRSSNYQVDWPYMNLTQNAHDLGIIEVQGNATELSQL